MPFSITHNTFNKVSENKSTKTREKNDICLTELKKLESCLDENKECMDLVHLWIKCHEKPNGAAAARGV